MRILLEGAIVDIPTASVVSWAEVSRVESITMVQDMCLVLMLILSSVTSG